MKSPAPAAAIVAKLYISRGRAYVFGPGKAELLEHIHETGSIADAAKSMELSYMRAWQLVKGMNTLWREPLVTTTRGGSKRGGAVVTATGLAVIRLYRELEESADAATKSAAKKFTALMK